MNLVFTRLRRNVTDHMFKNPANDEFFDSIWVVDCETALIEAMNSHTVSEAPNPTENVSRVTEKQMFAFLIDDDILGPSDSDAASTAQESAKEELMRCLRLARC